MAAEATTTESTPDAQKDQGTPKETERTVPLSEVQKERAKRQEAEQKLGTLEQRLAAIETERDEARRAGMSASERAADELKRAQEERDRLKADLEAERTKTKRDRVRSMIREAARDKGFHDPSDAVALVEDFSAITNEDEAREAVVRLADKRPHLVAKKAQKTDDLREVLPDGSVKDPQKADPQSPLIPASELESMSVSELADARVANPERFDRSVAAAGVTRN